MSDAILTSHPVNGFVPTSDATRARGFYEGILGLTFVNENPYVATYRSGDTMIIMQKVGEFTPVRYTILGWEVKDIEKVVSDLTKKGVVFERIGDFFEQDELGIWKSPDGKVAWFKDPDGNTLSVSEH